MIDATGLTLLRSNRRTLGTKGRSSLGSFTVRRGVGAGGSIDPQILRGGRNDRLRAAVATGGVTWQLEARRTLTLRWHPVARITLEREVEIDQEALRFDPFRTGAGVEPVVLRTDRSHVL